MNAILKRVIELRLVLIIISLTIGIVLGGGAVWAKFSRYLPMSVVAAQDQERRERIAGEAVDRDGRAELRLQIAKVSREQETLLRAFALFATALAESPNSPERAEALKKLRAMRRYELEGEP